MLHFPWEVEYNVTKPLPWCLCSTITLAQSQKKKKKGLSLVLQNPPTPHPPCVPGDTASQSTTVGILYANFVVPDLVVINSEWY